MTDVCLTFDVDWASEPVLEHLINKLTDLNLSATFFATHDSEVLKSLNSDFFEVGIHPNFNHSKGDIITPIKELKKIYPNAIGGRSHSLFSSSNILEEYEKAGLKYESNIFLPHHENLTVVRRRKNLMSIPFFWSDDYYLENKSINKKSIEKLLRVNGLKVFNFHPIHIFINTPSLKYYKKIKEYYHESEKLSMHKNKSHYGVENFFNDILNLINKYDINSIKIETVLKK